MDWLSRNFEWLFPFAVLALLCGFFFGANSYHCTKYEENTGIKTKMSGFECYGKVGNKWTPVDGIRLVR